MGLRLRENISLAKWLPGGLRLNFSRSGVSLSAGPRGATTNIGLNGVHETLGLPGTGISYRTGDVSGMGRRRRASWLWVVVALAVALGKYLLAQH